MVKTIFQDTCSYLFSSYIHSICVPQPSRACGTFRRDLIDMLLHEGLEAVANKCPNELSFTAWKTHFRTLVQISSLVQLYLLTVACLKKFYV